MPPGRPLPLGLPCPWVSSISESALALGSALLVLPPLWPRPLSGPAPCLAPPPLWPRSLSGPAPSLAPPPLWPRPLSGPAPSRAQPPLAPPLTVVSFLSPQVLRIHGVAQQQRVIAHDERRGRHLSIPVDFPVKFEVLDDRKKKREFTSNSHVLRRCAFTSNVCVSRRRFVTWTWNPLVWEKNRFWELCRHKILTRWVRSARRFQC